MTIYRNQDRNAALSAVEFSPVAEGNFSFFYVDSPLKKESVRSWLGEIGQEIIAETPVSGNIVFVTHGAKSRHDILDMLEKKDQHFAPEAHKRKFDPWITRAVLGFTGQSLQLVSSTMGKNRQVKWDTALFALSNIAANMIALVYGAQRSEDVHRLRFLKEKFNTDLSKELPAGKVLPDVDDNRVERHHGKPELGTKVHKFIERNSVRVGELALRYLGSIALAFPTYGWGRGWRTFKETNSIAEALKVAKNRDVWAYRTGMVSALGKTIALFSKEEDPYNPKPDTWLDTFREKVTFPLGGLIEAGAFGAYSYSRFADHKDHFDGTRRADRRIYIKGKPHTDYLGGTGSAMFVAAYLIRSGWAKFSERDVNMDELYAHVSDSLAHMPPDKLPQLMAETAASIKSHFKDKPMDFGQVFTQLMTDAYRYHHIALSNSPEALPRSAPDTVAPTATVGKHTLIAKRSAPNALEQVVASHAEKISKEIKAQPGLNT